METSKQLNIFQFFQNTPNSENQVGGFNLKEEEDRPTTSNVSHGGKRSRDGDMDCAETSKKRRRDFVRQYDKKYLELGFIIAPSSEKLPLPMCLVRAKVLSNDAMKPSKLTRHFHSQHSNLVGKAIAYFKRPLSKTARQRTDMQKMTTTDTALLKSSYLISLQIGKTKQSLGKI